MGALADAVRVLDDPKSTPDQISMVASRAKSRCGDAAHTLGRETIKLHGAIGFTDEYDVGLFLRRAMALARQQEMQALTKEYEALVVLAEAQIPSAIAAAFRDGQLHSRPTRRDYQPPRLRIHPELKSHSRPTEASGKSSAARVLEAWETEGGASFPSLPFRG